MVSELFNGSTYYFYFSVAIFSETALNRMLLVLLINPMISGKLRLLYEAAPMSFLVEQAGGLALTGRTRIMDVLPTSVHQRVPCILGSRDDVEEMRRYYENSDDPELLARCEARRSGQLETAA
jgi:hypothetical protein